MKLFKRDDMPKILGNVLISYDGYLSNFTPSIYTANRARGAVKWIELFQSL